MTAMLGHGVYSFSEASKLTHLKTSRIKEWFRGRNLASDDPPIFHGDYKPIEGNQVISFLDLIDVFVAGQLRQHGVSLQTLRRVYKNLSSDDLGTTHPFCRNELLSDGKQVFIRGLDKAGKEEVSEVLTSQRVFPEILIPFLKRIDYGKVTKLAEKWRIAELVVVDPEVCFGKPIVEPVGIPTALLAAAFEANNHDADLVADWYNVNSHHVHAAVEFERNMAA